MRSSSVAERAIPRGHGTHATGSEATAMGKRRAKKRTPRSRYESCPTHYTDKLGVEYARMTQVKAARDNGRT